MVIDLTDEQIRLAELAALQKATQNVKVMPLRLSEKMYVIENLVRINLRLEILQPLQGDIETRALLANFAKEKYAEVEAVLCSNPPLLLLGRFGAVPRVLIQAVFKSAGVACPVELHSFHAAYQEEIKALTGQPDTFTPLSSAKPA